MSKLLLIAVALLSLNLFSSQAQAQYSRTFHFAEGATGGGWDTHVYIYNQIHIPVQLRITIMGEYTTKVLNSGLPAFASTSFTMSSLIPGQSVGFKIESSHPIVDVVRYTLRNGAVITASREVTAAHGKNLPVCTQAGSAYNFVSIVNPSTYQTAFAYFWVNGVQQNINVPPLSRRTFMTAAGASVSYFSYAAGPVAVEQVAYDPTLTQAKLCQ